MIYLDISREDRHDMRRDDIGHPNRGSVLEIIQDVSVETFMPITIGGRIRTIAHIEERLALGADKIAINTQAADDPGFITQAAKEFGSQCVVVSIDVVRNNESLSIKVDGGRRDIRKDPVDWAHEVQERGAGEILLNSIDRDGQKTGYDIDLLKRVSNEVSIPVIACGGVGEWAHFSEAFDKTGVDAVAAANIFHYIDQSVYLSKKYLFERRYNVRPPDLMPV